MAVLHPTKACRTQPAYLDVLKALQSGDLPSVETLASLDDSQLSRFARLQLFRLRAEWQETRDYLDARGAQEIATDPQAMVSYVRCLGELGEIELMLQVCRQIGAKNLGHLHSQLVLFVLAFAGKHRSVAHLFDGLLRFYPVRARDYWVATALQVSGDAASARTLLLPLSDAGDPSLKLASARRLNEPLGKVDFEKLSDDSRSLISKLSKYATDVAIYGSLGLPPKKGSTVATWTLMAVLTIVILIELPGGATDQANLYRLGALELSADPSRVTGSWWRIVTAAFLHFGLSHYAANLFGLFFLGRYMERMWGAAGVLACYLIAAIGANAAAIYLLAPPTGNAFVVGASGGVMGIVGGLVALLLAEWLRTRTRLLLRQLALLGLVLVVQLVFDLSTPNVSSTIHLSGAFIGLLTGIGLAWLHNIYGPKK